jgi:hypothetical protein
MEAEWLEAKKQWFPATHPPELARYQKRTPGLFKEEFRGTEMVCLSAKTYVVYNEDADQCKFSSKGAQKRQVHEPMKLYKSVLETREPATVTNRGIRKRNGVLHTYAQDRRAFDYVYWKRQVQDDGRSTRPLDI